MMNVAKHKKKSLAKKQFFHHDANKENQSNRRQGQGQTSISFFFDQDLACKLKALTHHTGCGDIELWGRFIGVKRCR